MKRRKLPTHGRALRAARAAAVKQLTVERASRNLEKERGRQILFGEVAAHALAGHVKCRGTGMVSRGETSAEPCSCATKRFLARYPGVIIDATDGTAWWPRKVADVEVVGEEGG